jgi:hypothetical protein
MFFVAEKVKILKVVCCAVSHRFSAICEERPPCFVLCFWAAASPLLQTPQKRNDF